MKCYETSKSSRTWPTQISTSLGIMAISCLFILHFVHPAFIFYCLMLVGKGIHMCMSYLPRQTISIYDYIILLRISHHHQNIQHSAVYTVKFSTNTCQKGQTFIKLQWFLAQGGLVLFSSVGWLVLPASCQILTSLRAGTVPYWSL